MPSTLIICRNLSGSEAQRARSDTSGIWSKHHTFQMTQKTYTTRKGSKECRQRVRRVWALEPRAALSLARISVSSHECPDPRDLPSRTVHRTGITQSKCHWPIAAALLLTLLPAPKSQRWEATEPGPPPRQRLSSSLSAHLSSLLSVSQTNSCSKQSTRSPGNAPGADGVKRPGVPPPSSPRPPEHSTRTLGVKPNV